MPGIVPLSQDAGEYLGMQGLYQSPFHLRESGVEADFRQMRIRILSQYLLQSGVGAPCREKKCPWACLQNTGDEEIQSCLIVDADHDCPYRYTVFCFSLHITDSHLPPSSTLAIWN